GPYHFEKSESKLRRSIAAKIFGLCYSKLNLRNVVVVCPSHYTKDKITNSKNIKVKEVTFIPNAVMPSDKVCPVELLSGFPLSRNLVLISANWDDPRKGLNTFLTFLDKVASLEQKVWTVHLIGNIRKLERFEKFSSRLRIVKYGFLNREKSCEIMTSCEYLVCPSLEDNSPNVITEAFSHGRAVLAQCGSGADSYVTPSVGCLFDFKNCSKGNVESFLQFYYSNDPLLLGKYSKERANNEYSPGKIGQLYTELYLSYLYPYDSKTQRESI
ncbi:glycosyltransferase, partial [Vibrio parahaemolyticus]